MAIYANLLSLFLSRGNCRVPATQYRYIESAGWQLAIFDQWISVTSSCATCVFVRRKKRAVDTLWIFLSSLWFLNVFRARSYIKVKVLVADWPVRHSIVDYNWQNEMKVIKHVINALNRRRGGVSPEMVTFASTRLIGYPGSLEQHTRRYVCNINHFISLFNITDSIAVEDVHRAIKFLGIAFVEDSSYIEYHNIEIKCSIEIVLLSLCSYFCTSFLIRDSIEWRYRFYVRYKFRSILRFFFSIRFSYMNCTIFFVSNHYSIWWKLCFFPSSTNVIEPRSPYCYSQRWICNNDRHPGTWSCTL